jgi:HEPN domain-containing protein
MSQPQAPSPSEEWLQIARKDFKRAKRNLEDSDVEAAGFFLQQSLEKYLKAFLLRHGWLLKKIHTLHVLLDEAIQYLPRLDEFYSLCERVSGYYILDRYPPLGALDLTGEDVARDVEAAKPFIQAMFPGEAPSAGSGQALDG